jgi:hypothetical protein
MAKTNTDEKMTDSQAKNALRDGRRWPMRTKALWGEGGVFYKLLPKSNKGGKGHYLYQGPYLHPCGSPNIALGNPDGLYVHFGNLTSKEDLWFCDIIAIEHSGTLQNFWDKRARYRSLTAAMMLRVPIQALQVSGYGQGTGDKTLETCLEEDCREEDPNYKWKGADRSYPIRHLRTIYALGNAHYGQLKVGGFPVPAGELIIEHKDLKNKAPMTNFSSQLERLNPNQQWIR